MGPIGGLLVRVDGVVRFLPASVALTVAAPPRVTPVPGAPPELVGIAVHEGTIVPVLAIGARRGEMIVCQHAGETVGLVGGEVIRTGSFSPASGRTDAVVHEGSVVESLDLAAAYQRVASSARPVRWG